MIPKYSQIAKYLPVHYLNFRINWSLLCLSLSRIILDYFVRWYFQITNPLYYYYYCHLTNF